MLFSRSCVVWGLHLARLFNKHTWFHNHSWSSSRSCHLTGEESKICHLHLRLLYHKKMYPTYCFKSFQNTACTGFCWTENKYFSLFTCGWKEAEAVWLFPGRSKKKGNQYLYALLCPQSILPTAIITQAPYRVLSALIKRTFLWNAQRCLGQLATPGVTPFSGCLWILDGRLAPAIASWSKLS